MITLVQVILVIRIILCIIIGIIGLISTLILPPYFFAVLVLTIICLIVPIITLIAISGAQKEGKKTVFLNTMGVINIVFLDLISGIIILVLGNEKFSKNGNIANTQITNNQVNVTTSYCTNCGAKLDENELFCPKCGQKKL